ncbi:hypothetical protein H6G54_03300 [Anabaena cylindrica FACHB-243]|uniref:Uncharacterized protein n=1 Tax=Anabaena cylindrica (strain ATCC 27899 / PCC 7122) TaxID=272123 RepID=K9ZL51_ANACC|nr:hypothetical protein Anacy_4568 [Anabaena cylindrica PCC 7122]MBD2416752.1 hypothetical protein [Anabaena cylindrica FACHB-243]
MNTCPCCSNIMTRNFRQHHIYWFCRSCWQEMPILAQKSLNTLVTPLPKHPLALV